jgi:molybdate/tungstate transport system ATP-binding protein
MTGLKLEGVSKAWRNFRLRDIDLEAKNGQYFVILGPTGAGKTLLLEIIMGFHKPDEGRILLNDRDITPTLPEKREIGYVPQNCILFPHMNVRQNVEFGLRARGIQKVERARATDKMLNFMRLGNLADRMPMTLSGGEKQKVALARVLVIEPQLVLLDEPFTAIDAEASRWLKDELKRIHQGSDVAIVHVTHSQIEAFSLAEQVAIMKGGQIVQSGNAREVFANPCDEFVAGFLGFDNIFKAKLVTYGESTSRVGVEGLVFNVAGRIREDQSTIGIRSEDITVSKVPRPSPDSNSISGTVTDYADLGPVITVTIDIGFPVKAGVPKRSFLEMRLDRGDQVWLIFDAASVKVLG